MARVILLEKLPSALSIGGQRAAYFAQEGDFIGEGALAYWLRLLSFYSCSELGGCFLTWIPGSSSDDVFIRRTAQRFERVARALLISEGRIMGRGDRECGLWFWSFRLGLRLGCASGALLSLV